MSNLSDLIALLAGLSDTQQGAILADVKAKYAGGSAAPVWGTPDAMGFFPLAGITNPDYANLYHACQETSQTLPIDTYPRGCADENVFHANGLANPVIGFVGCEGIQVDQSIDPQTGKFSYSVHKPYTNLPNRFVWPPIVFKGYNLATAAGVVAYVNTLAPSVTNQGQGFGQGGAS